MPSLPLSTIPSYSFWLRALYASQQAQYLPFFLRNEVAFSERSASLLTAPPRPVHPHAGVPGGPLASRSRTFPAQHHQAGCPAKDEDEGRLSLFVFLSLCLSPLRLSLFLSPLLLHSKLKPPNHTQEASKTLKTQTTKYARASHTTAQPYSVAQSVSQSVRPSVSRSAAHSP